MFLEVELKSQVKSRSRWFSCFEAFCNTSAAAHSGWSLKGRRSGLSWMEIWNSWRLMMWIRKTIPRNWFDTFTLTIGVCFGQAAVRNLEEANTQLNAAVLVLALDRMVMMALMQKSGVSWDAMRCHEMSWGHSSRDLWYVACGTQRAPGSIECLSAGCVHLKERKAQSLTAWAVFPCFSFPAMFWILLGLGWADAWRARVGTGSAWCSPGVINESMTCSENARGCIFMCQIDDVLGLGGMERPWLSGESHWCRSLMLRKPFVWVMQRDFQAKVYNPKWKSDKR